MKRPHDKGKVPPNQIPLLMRREIPQKQLAAIGALALAFNEVEATLDRMFFLVTLLPEHLQWEVSTRIGGIDGKIEIIKRGAKPLLDESDWLTLTDALGENGFKLLKSYRDGVIHVRHLNAATSVGIKVDSRAQLFDFLVRQDALEAGINLADALQRELGAANALLRTTTSLSNSVPDDPERASAEVLTIAFRAQFHKHRSARQALPPFPEFPSESELHAAEIQFQQAELTALMGSLGQNWELPLRREFSPALWNALSTAEPPLPLREAQPKKLEE